MTTISWEAGALTEAFTTLVLHGSSFCAMIVEMNEKEEGGEEENINVERLNK